MKIVICGAGIAGLALANGLLGHDDIEVVIVERSPQPRQQGYMIDFFGPGYLAAIELGVRDELHRRARAIDQVSWYDNAGRVTARMRYEVIASAAEGKLVSLLRQDVEETLRLEVEDRVQIRWGAAVTAVHNSTDHVRAELSDGTAVDADLLVGADGIHSQVRTEVFGEEQEFLRPLGFHTSAWVFSDPAVRAEVGGQFVMTDTMDAAIGLYGLDDGIVAGFGVHRTPEVALPSDARTAVREAYADLGWVVPEVLEHCPPGPELYYDIVAQVEVPRWVDRRVVLLGDSCQAVSLIAGQGASLAVAGGHLLSRALVEAGTDIEAALAVYEERWRPIVEAKQRAGRNGVRWFLPSNRRDLLVRRGLMKVSGLPGISRLLVNGVAGKQGNALPDVGLSSGSVGRLEAARQHRHHQVSRGR